MRSRLATGLAVVLALLLVLPPIAALADGDPASDVLLGENVFYPYQPATSKSLMASLNTAAAAAAKAHFPIKVALIAVSDRPRGHPAAVRQAAGVRQVPRLGDQLPSKQPLLVVMKDGYGVEGLPAAATAAAAKLALPAGGTQRRARAGRAHRDRQAGRRGRPSDRRRRADPARRAAAAGAAVAAQRCC